MDSSALQFKDTVLGLGTNKLWVDLGNGTGIVEIGYSGDAVAVAAKISSAGDKASNTFNEYRMGVDASIKAVPNLEATAGAYTAMSGQTDFVAPIHMGVKVGYTVKLSEDMSVKPFAGAEIIMHGEDDMKMEIGGGINLKWPGISWDYDWALGDAMIDYWVGWPKHFVNFSGANLYVNYVSLDADTNMVGARVTMFDDTGDSGILPMVGVGLLGIMNMYLASDTVAESYNEIGVGLWMKPNRLPASNRSWHLKCSWQMMYQFWNRILQSALVLKSHQFRMQSLPLRMTDRVETSHPMRKPEPSVLLEHSSDSNTTKINSDR